MGRLLRTVVGALMLAVMLLWFGCGEDIVGGEVAHLCPGDECVSCDSHNDCEYGTYCHPGEDVCISVSCDGDDDCDDNTRCSDDGQCVGAVCEPGEPTCAQDGASITYCNQEGSGYHDSVACDTGVCEGGQCGCEDVDDCASGHECSGDLCVCPSNVTCGDDGVCCGDDEVCSETEICDDDGNCEQFSECQPECAGEWCGFDGDICCDGDEPVCGPGGQCVPDCSETGDICGDDFDQCCPTGQLCIFGDCVEPGEPCSHFADCDFGEYCDQGIGQCLPDDFPEGLVCEDEYDFDDVQPEVMWQWEGVDIDGTTYSNVMMTPMVADMDGNGTPNVFFNAYSEDGGGQSVPVIVDGATGDTLYYNTTHWTDFGAQLAAADITGNGLPELVALANGSDGVGVIKNIADCPDPEQDVDGCYLWWNGDDIDVPQGAPVVADLNADGNVELILGDTILDGQTGDLIATLPSGGYSYTVAADVNDDGTLEILGAGCLYSLDSQQDLTEVWCASETITAPGKRYVAVGDLTDEDGRSGLPEFVITGDETVYVVAADSGEMLYDFELPGGGAGGSPIIADFDGDGSAEFGVAGAACYTVFDLDCLAPDATDASDLMQDRPGCTRPQIDTCDVGHHCACQDLHDTMGTGDGILWSIYVQDESSNRTGSSVFDFQGDGRNEIVYNDECLLMVLDGQTGSPYFLYGNTNRTSSEYPIVADVTGDNQTNIVVSANNDQFSRDCETPIATQPERFPDCHPDDADADIPAWCTEGTHGVIALQDPEDRWVRTRSIWNQFDYYIDNATDDAGVPTSPNMPWESHNTFRANQQGEVPLNAPDIAVTNVQVDSLACPPDIDFRVTIMNQGMAAIPAGLPVSLYLLDGSEGGQLLATETIDEAVSPGGMAQVDFTHQVQTNQINVDLDFQVVANDDGADGEPVRDCNPDNAVALLEDIVCSYAP